MITRPILASLLALAFLTGCGSSDPPPPPQASPSAAASTSAVPTSSLGQLLLEASGRGHAPAVETLIKTGAPANWADEDGMTALHAAAWRARKSVISVLLENGASLDARTREGVTPLHSALLNTRVPEEVRATVAELLIFRGADINATTATGATPLACAPEGSALATLIEKHGGIRKEPAESPEPDSTDDPAADAGGSAAPADETGVAGRLMRRLVGRTFLNSVVKLDATLDESNGS